MHWRSATTLPLVPLTAVLLLACEGGLPDTEPAHAAAERAGPTVAVTVREGTSMAVGVAPDGRALVIDLQGTLWVVPAGGGVAIPITDGLDDARQPAWSPDGRAIAFQGYRAGGYDIWSVVPDGTGLRQLTFGSWDDREPAWSGDGTRVAFSSDRGGNGSYDIWQLEVSSGELRQLTTSQADEALPTWSPDGSEVAFARTGGGMAGIWAVSLATGEERRLTGPGTAPSWGPGGQLVYHVAQGGTSRLELDGRTLTGDENVFAFRAAWADANTLVYVSDGRIRKRTLDGGDPITVEFEATLTVARARYERRVRDFDSRAQRPVLGVLSPRVAPGGDAVAFVALGDLWLARRGAAPERLTRDAAMELDPAWSPDGRLLAYASDRAGGPLDLWVRDLTTGTERRLTALPVSATGPAWSPDGTRIAFLEVNGQWRRAAVSVVDVASGEITRIQPPLFGPGDPTWSPDGRWVAVAALAPYSGRFREGTNRILLIPSEADEREARWVEFDAHQTLDTRAGGGPAWSPDGTTLAFVQDGQLMLLPVTAAGEPTGPARVGAAELAHAPSWTADSRRLLYQVNDGLRLLDVATGAATDWPLTLTYTPDVPSEQLVVHAGLLWDGLRPEARADVDVVVDGNRIVAVEPHREANHQGRRVVDASGLTVMPGLIEHHSHLQPDFGERHGRAWLAFGITTVRSPGGTPYEAVELREAIHAGTRLGPRIFATGYLLEWQRAYYKMSVAVQDDAHLEAELERARRLEHDLVKSYVRMPDPQQRRIVEFAHAMGVPSSSHEIFPAAAFGIDGVEHTTGTSRRGYSPKVATLQRSYEDVAAIVGAAGMTLTPTFALSATWLRGLIALEPALAGDPRFDLLPGWLTQGLSADGGAAAAQGAPVAGPVGDLVLSVRDAGGRIVAGTDSPNPASLHAELLAYVAAGMSPFEALQTATVHAAAALALDAGIIEPGRLADLVAVAGNPLENIAHTQRVRLVVANGRVLELERLLGSSSPPR